MITKDKIIEILQSSIDAHHIQIDDESHNHINHPQAKQHGGGHFALIIVSDDFCGVSTVPRHRMVYTALKGKMGSDIHALTIKTFTQEEYNNR